MLLLDDDPDLRAALCDFVELYRDLVNSPLQTIELLCAMLRRAHPESTDVLDRLGSSTSRLKAMGEMLSRTEHQVVWTSKEEAFDAAQVIEEYHRSAAS